MRASIRKIPKSRLEMSSSAKLSLAALACVLAASISSGQLVGPPSNRIINGEPAEPGEFPFIVSMEYLDVGDVWSHGCGGSVIDQRHILTAAHCVLNGYNDYKPNQIRVKLGCHKLSKCDELVEIDSIKVHPDHHRGNNDVAILVLKRKIIFNQEAGSTPIGKIRLARKLQADENWGNLTVIGWGSTSVSSFGSDVLQKVQVAAVSFAECKKKYTLIGDDEMCAGARGVDSCNGDSGGPLFKTLADGTQLQVGIVSRGAECGSSDVGGNYARVASFYSWIMNCTQGNKC